MCGLVGVATVSDDLDRWWLGRARDSLIHRGPDDAGEWWSQDGRVGLAHRRLAILDLSQAGHQPMHFQERQLTVVFNGEIYNFLELRRELEGLGHCFRSRSDTEVLLAAYSQWGTECLPRLNGMFAFAIHDAREKRMFLARDRAGEKPLFYRYDGGSLLFASELKALLTHPDLPRTVDSNALDCYLAMGFVPGDRCILQGFRKLPPAHAMTFDLVEGSTELWRYWHLPALEPVDVDIDEGALLDELEALLEDAVSRQLVADVPVGILLSGGVDSSLVTAMATRRSSHVRTFTVGFPGHRDLDESRHARLVAQHFGTEHIELMATAATAEVLPVLARQFDEPIADSSMVPTLLVSELIRQHCTVALGGDGGDELFGGYRHHSRLLWLHTHLSRVPLGLRQALASCAESALPVGIKGRNYMLALGADLDRSLPIGVSYFDPSARLRLLSTRSEDAAVAERIFRSRIPDCPDLLQRVTRMDFENYLADDILVKVDRASMLKSLEVRAPILDHRLVEFAFSRIPSYLKNNGREKKILLKRLAGKVLPAAFDMQRKQGFSIPIDQWLQSGPFRELVWDTLLSEECPFDAGMMRTMLRRQKLGLRNGERIFALVQFELWRREYRAAV